MMVQPQIKQNKIKKMYEKLFNTELFYLFKYT